MTGLLHLTLGLPLAELGRLRRHPSLQPAEEGAVRKTRRRLVWHDTPDAALARQGLALVASLRVWRLEQAQPGAAQWPPCGAVPVLAEAASLADLGGALAAVLPAANGQATAFAPFGSCVLHEIGLTVGPADAAIEVRIVHGTIRAADRKLPVTRLLLDGPEGAVVALASTLAETVSLLPPRAGLAAEAIALREGTAPPPRRAGAVTCPRGLTVGETFPLVVAHLADTMLYWARAVGAPGESPEPVHQTRVAMRRLRSAFSVFRDSCVSPPVAAAGEELRSLGRVLGPARDWDVFLAGIGKRIADAAPGIPAVRHVLKGAERRRALAYRNLATHLAGPRFRRLLIGLAAIAAGTGWRDGLTTEQRDALAMPLDRFAANMLARRNRRLRKRGAHFRHLDVQALHAVRLATKRLRYAIEFFSALHNARAAARHMRRLAELQDRLGHINDGSVADTLLAELGTPEGRNGYAIGLVRGFVLAEAAHHQEALAGVWKRFRKLDPFWN